jgi:hypothetical protein
VRRLTHLFLILLAIVFLIEAWLWRHLGPIVEWIVACLPLRAVKARIAGIVRKLPPAATLVVFAVPVAALFPLKFIGFWLLAHKQWIAAATLLAFAKLFGLAITAFLFKATKPKLLQLAWFRWLYEHVLAWLKWARDLVAPIRRRIKRFVRILRAKQTGRALRLLRRIRRRMSEERGGAGLISADAARGVRTGQTP